MKSFYDTRLLLEVSLVPEIINHLDDQSMNRLQRAFDIYQKAVNEENYFNRLMKDMKFHLTLASISQCQIQLKMLQELFDMLLLKYTRNLILLGIMDTSLNEHTQIFEALAGRDTQGLEQALSIHLDSVRSHIISGFKKMFAVKPGEMVDLFSLQ